MGKLTKGGSYYFGIGNDATMVIGFKRGVFSQVEKQSDSYKYVAGLNGSTCGNTKVYRSLDTFLNDLNDKRISDEYIYVMVNVGNVKLTEDEIHSIQYYSHNIMFEDSPNPNVPYLSQFPI